LEEYELEETQGIVRMERICVPTNHGVEVEVGYTVGKEKGKAFVSLVSFWSCLLYRCASGGGGGFEVCSVDWLYVPRVLRV
jgi:hypothetical protein